MRAWTAVLLTAAAAGLSLVVHRHWGAEPDTPISTIRIPPPYSGRGVEFPPAPPGTAKPASTPQPSPPSPATPAAGVDPGSLPEPGRGCVAETVRWGEVDFGPKFRPPPSSPPTMQKVSCPSPPARKLEFFTNDLFMKQFKGTRFAKLRSPWDSSWTDVLALAPTDYVMHIPRVTLGPGKWQPAIHDGTHLIDQTEGCGAEQVSAQPPTGGARPSYAKGIILTQKWGGEVYHFMLENLPKLGLLHAAGVDPTNVTVFVHSSKAKHIVNYLALFGVPADHIVNAPRGGEAVAVDDLYVANQLKCGYSSFAGIQLSRALLAARHPVLREGWAAARQEPRVLVIRRHGQRAVHNHDALVAALGQRWPVKVYDHKDHPDPADVMRLFSRAAVVVAPHGAGLGNVMFSRAGVGVLEFSHPQPHDLNLCFWYVTVLVGGGPFSMLSFPTKGSRWEVGVQDTVDDTARLMERVLAAWGQQVGDSN